MRGNQDRELLTGAASAAGRRAAASYLLELLVRPGGYRRLWEQYVVRARRGGITQLAVAEVLGRHLWSYPRGHGDAGRHQTLSLHDHVYVGAEGLPARARTLQVIEATADGLDRIPYLYDTKALTLEVGQGCTKQMGDLYQVSDELFVTFIFLARTLDIGETITLEYWTTFQYPGDPLDPHEREYRRAVMRRLENFDMRVEFHPGKLPAGVWWASWDGVDGEILEQEAVGLDSQHSVHRYLRFIEKTVAGFYWSWSPRE